MHNEEMFVTYARGRDDEAVVAGLHPRSQVHALGLWHKSAQVFVFDDEGRLLLQRRVAHKDLYANLWDYSVGEHLQPGETFRQGALRGLQEELGIVTPEPLSLLGDERWVEFSSSTHTDREIQQAFRCEYCGELVLDPQEVAQVRHSTLAELADWVARSPADFTPWFVQDVHEFGLLI